MCRSSRYAENDGFCFWKYKLRRVFIKAYAGYFYVRQAVELRR